ncbi:hypothetical protein ACFVGN_04560 [Streptomyces sp. NPDC057757]|uniref:hypothetical protein n=1 Tax=Streptomyces sp. NPDC057757 TaxID=3346241 RepID=UPI00368FB18E
MSDHDLAAVEEWRDHVEHRAAKKYGREHRYERYGIPIAKVEHSHGFRRERGREWEWEREWEWA